MKTTAIIMAGGLATRMRENCFDVPKSMLSFGGKPFLEYLICWLISKDIGEVVICASHLVEKIEEKFLADYWKKKGVKVVCFPLLGTGHALREAAINIKNEELFVCNGDTVVEFDWNKIHRQRQTINFPVCSILTPNQGVQNQGAIYVKNHCVLEFCEDGTERDVKIGKKHFRGSSTGCYFFKKSIILEQFPEGACSLEKDVLPKLVEKRLVGAVLNSPGVFLDFGVPERYAQLQQNAGIIHEIYKIPSQQGREYEQSDRPEINI